MKIYMFRTVPLSIIRSFSPYAQQWYMSHTCLLTACEQEQDGIEFYLWRLCCLMWLSVAGRVYCKHILLTYAAISPDQQHNRVFCTFSGGFITPSVVVYFSVRNWKP